MANMNCVVVTPEKTVLDVESEMVVVPMIDGENGIATGHAPMIGRLGYGELRVTTGGTTSNYFVDGGFIQVAENVVSVITNRAILVSDIDKAAAEKLLADAQAMTGTSVVEMEEKERLCLQARAQIRLAK